MDIKQIHIGIPNELKSIIFWVQQKYRVNDLSSINGGTDVVVEYKNGDVFGYDKIKFPSKYVEKIFAKYFDENITTVEKLQKFVIRIFARKNDGSNLSDEKFIEIWNSTSTELPFNILETYQLDIYKKYLALFLSDKQFANEYISANYPFQYDVVINNWNNLTQGSGHYSTLISEIDSVYTSKFGLSYNKRIRWNSKLRARYEYGFDNPYMGYVDGLGYDPVEFEEKDFQDEIIPLDFEKEISVRNWLIFQTAKTLEDTLNLDNHKFFENEAPLSFDQISKLWATDRLKLLINESIWDKTMSKIIDDTFCEIVIEKCMEQ